MSKGRQITRVEGLLVLPNQTVEGAITIDPKTGLIAAVDVGPGVITGESDLDTTGCLIFPGFGDIHIHAREDVTGEQNYKEEFRTAAAAAIHGGVTHVADMPNNPSAPVDQARYEAKEKLVAKTEEESGVHFTLYAGIGPGTSPLKRLVPYKAYMGPSVGDLFFRSQAELEETIQRYTGQTVSFHCEDPETLDAHADQPTHEQRRPPVAEVTATRFALHLIEKYSLVGKLCHYSVGEGLPLIQEAKEKGHPVTAEVTPHHLFFDTSMLTDENHKLLQMNPPLRSPEDRQKMIEALRSGLIDYVATDHAPHTLEEKAVGHSGVPHLDTFGAFACWLMAEHHFTPQDIARVCAENPGRFVSAYLPVYFGRGIGRLEQGFAGNLTILDPNKPYEVDRASQRTKCGWSPFEGFTLPGQVRWTVTLGTVVGG